MPMFRKRTYATTFRNGTTNRNSRFKRRRFTRARRANRRGGRKTLDYTGLNTRGHVVGFRGRRISRRAYKNHIWNSTIFKPHFRSILTTSFTDTAPANFGTTADVLQFNMYRNAVAGDFWTAGGGAQIIDEGDTLPLFKDEIVLRGGKYELTIANQSGDDVKVKLWRLTTVSDPDLAIIPLNVDSAWDPTVTPDWNNKVGKPFMSREVTIQGGDSYTFVDRFRTQKIDQEAYDDQARTPYIILTFTNVNSNTATQCLFTARYNLSFTGDIIS